jgi:hypothetical protein
MTWTKKIKKEQIEDFISDSAQTALDLKADKSTKWFTTDVTHTGNTNETILKAIQFSGTDWSENDILSIIAEFKKVGTAGTCTWRIKVNSTNDLSGSSTIGLLTGAAVAIDLGKELKRCIFKSGNILEHPTFATGFTDITGFSVAKVSTSITYSSTWFLLITGQLANSTDTISCPMGYIQKI